MIRWIKDIKGTIGRELEQRCAYPAQIAAQILIGEVLTCLLKILYPVGVGRACYSEPSNLRKNVPHPMPSLFAGFYLAERGGVIRLRVIRTDMVSLCKP